MKLLKNPYYGYSILGLPVLQAIYKKLIRGVFGMFYKRV